MTNSIAELEGAQCIFVIGSNTTEAHPLVANRILRAKARGSKLVVADPREIHLAQFADVYVQQRLGTDVALINGIMHVICVEGWEDKDYVSSRTEELEKLKEVVESYTPKRVQEITGVDGKDVRKIAELYARSESSSICYAMGITQHTTGVDNVKALANLAMLCGKVGIEGGGVNPLRGQNNVQGACDMGALPNVYPGYQAVTDPAVQEKFQKAWGANLSGKAGLTIMDMMKGAEEGKVRALYVMGENPMLSDPDLRHVEEALKSVEFLVVQDMFLTETASLAHVVLPSASFAEKDGTYTNTERRVQRVRKAIEPLHEAKSDSEILGLVAKKMGYDMTFSPASLVQEEIARLTPSYGGILYERIEEEGLQWPCPDKEHPGTKYLHRERFARGKGLFHPVEYKEPAETEDETFPYLLTTGRTFVHYHTGTMTRNSPSLHDEMPEGFVEVNPEDAQALGLKEGEVVKITSRRGSIQTRARITDRIGRGTVFVPFHFAEAAANMLTNAALDPVAKIPEYKVCSVSLEKVQ